MSAMSSNSSRKNNPIGIGVALDTAKKSFVVASLSLLSACVGTVLPLGDASPDNWQLQGKIGLVYPKPGCGGNDCPLSSDQGNLSWQQRDKNYSIRVADPFNRVLINLQGDPQTMTVTQPGQAPTTTTPAEFLQRLAAASRQPAILTQISPNDLRYWLTGRQSPDATATQKNDVTFVQRGFTIRATQWRDTAVGNMPSLIVISKGQFRLRLVVREWAPVGSKN